LDVIRNTFDAEITRVDIETAIKSFKPLKVPGPNGFHPIFFQKYWHIIGDSVTRYIQDIFRQQKIPQNLNSTLVCLIPKVANPESISQFRPIGLCKTLYKTITKILVLRLKPFLNDLIHPYQASFISGRKASDNVIMVQEIIHSMTLSHSKVGYMAVKIDLEKAYDRLEWSFIRHTLQFFNFPDNWIDLIMSCISTSTLSVLFNGDHLHEFTPFRGIRQGDPLSPYIFILCMEYLAWLIQAEVDAGNWTGVKTSRFGPSFTHLFFVDDLVFFAKATRKNSKQSIKSWENFASFRGKRSILLNLVFLFLLTQILIIALSWKVSWVLKSLRNLVSIWGSLSLLMVETSVHMTSLLKKSVQAC
jgi:hypothetical protein